MQGVIHSIELNENTYDNVTLNPTLINFFFGKNGVGKSTIAHKIEGKNFPDISLNNYEVLVYNSDFIHRNIREDATLSGVFSLGEENIEIKQSIAQKESQLQNLRREYVEHKNLCDKKSAALDQLKLVLKDKCWKETEWVRNNLPETIKGYRTKIAMANQLLTITVPRKHNMNILANICQTAFGSDDTIFQKLSTIDLLELQSIFGFDTLAKVITGSADTPFADFIRLIGAVDWIKQGHQKFSDISKNQCPYCKQELPVDYEQQFASCFDERYEVDCDALQKFQLSYLSAVENILKTVQQNKMLPSPNINLAEYINKVETLNVTLELNKKMLSDKITAPSMAITLGDVDGIINELNEMIDTVNQSIETHNTIIQSKKGKQKECITYVWEHMAFLTRSILAEYTIDCTSIQHEIDILNFKMSALKEKGPALKKEISTLMNQISNVESTMHNMNQKLSDSGFQGFQLAKDKVDDTKYVVVRNDGSLAQNLSDGERNFIAFLYFYHKVMGIETSEATVKEKIVVIDDPVSSMDTSSLFIVSSIVREMMAICLNNTATAKQTAKRFIRQMFVLTHNTTFHKQLSYDKIKQYESVNFYLITKSQNVSTIQLCTKKDQSSNTSITEKNYTPVYNGYTALWKEYNEVSSTSSLMRIVRQILTHYFIQMSGYEGDTLLQKIASQEAVFVSKNPDGGENRDLFLIAQSMLRYSSSEIEMFDDELYLSDHWDFDSLKNAFQQVFVAMDQMQHYEMMIERAT